MDFYTALHYTQILLAIAFIQQSLEHVLSKKDLKLFAPKLVLSILLILGIQSSIILVLLVINALMILKRFNGPYNGGCDRISTLTLICLCAAHCIPSQQISEYVFSYLAIQLIASYFIAGVFKALNKDWWNGQAIKDIFLFSSFPANEALRNIAKLPITGLTITGIITVIFELAFPVALLGGQLIWIVLALALVFHLFTAYFFGFNRFVWAWLAAYPSLLWVAS